MLFVSFLYLTKLKTHSRILSTLATYHYCLWSRYLSLFNYLLHIISHLLITIGKISTTFKFFKPSVFRVWLLKIAACFTFVKSCTWGKIEKVFLKWQTIFLVVDKGFQAIPAVRIKKAIVRETCFSNEVSERQSGQNLIPTMLPAVTNCLLFYFIGAFTFHQCYHSSVTLSPLLAGSTEV